MRRYPFIRLPTASPNAASGADLVLNFGATPFVYAPDTVLSGAGVDVSELGVGWGPANLP